MRRREEKEGDRTRGKNKEDNTRQTTDPGTTRGHGPKAGAEDEDDEGRETSAPPSEQEEKEEEEEEEEGRPNASSRVSKWFEEGTQCDETGDPKEEEGEEEEAQRRKRLA